MLTGTLERDTRTGRLVLRRSGRTIGPARIVGRWDCDGACLLQVEVRCLGGYTFTGQCAHSDRMQWCGYLKGGE